MIKNPELSVIIPAYNEENYILPCLHSVATQDFSKEKYEVIVVDNNSKDKTAKIVKENFPQIRIVNEKKQGVVFARIKGIKESRGKIIVFIDADGIAPKDWLKKIYKTYRKNKNIAGIGGGYILDHSSLKKKTYEKIVNFTTLAFKTYVGTNMSFKKDSYLKSGGFSTKINMSEDFFISKKIKKVGKLIILKDNDVITSDRRLTRNFISYTVKYLINIATISFFEKAAFFDFEAIRKSAKISPKLSDLYYSKLHLPKR